MNRRALLSAGIALLPLASALLAACGEDTSGWPQGMAPIKWDRDTCAKCGMVISDRRFAVQIRGAHSGQARDPFKFDDIGCAAKWYSENLPASPWLLDTATRYWVADFDSGGTTWLDARRARFAPGPRSPMGYDMAAYASKADGIDFVALAQRVAQGGGTGHGGHANGGRG